MNTKTWQLLAAAAAALMLSAAQADDGSLTKSEAKDLKTQSSADYKANKKIADANEELNKGDCKTALDGGAQRSCVKSAKAEAKSDKHAAKAVHQVEKKAIDNAKQ